MQIDSAPVASSPAPAGQLRLLDRAAARAIGYTGPLTTAEDWADLTAWLGAIKGLTAWRRGCSVAIFTGRWEGRSDGSWSEQGVAAAEERVRGYLGQLAALYAEAISDAAHAVLSTLDRRAALASFRPALLAYQRGAEEAEREHLVGEEDGPALARERAKIRRAAAEEAIWSGFRRRLAILAGA